MPTTPTPAELLHAELEALRQSDEGRAARVKRIEELQLPFMATVMEAFDTKPIPELISILTEAVPNLTDSRQGAVSNLVSHVEYAVTHMMQEVERIQSQIEPEQVPE